MAYVTKIYNGSQTLNIRDAEALHPDDDGSLRYPFVTLTGPSCTLADRSVNILAMGEATTATITMPAAINGRARDFWLVLTTTTTAARTYTLTGGTFYPEDETTFSIASGTTYPNIFVFTEFEKDKYFVSRRTPNATGTVIL